MAINTAMNVAAIIIWGVARIPIRSWWELNLKPTTYIGDAQIQFDSAAFGKPL